MYNIRLCTSDSYLCFSVIRETLMMMSLAMTIILQHTSCTTSLTANSTTLALISLSSNCCIVETSLSLIASLILSHSS